MPPLEMFSHALEALGAGTASKAERQLIGDAFRSGQLRWVVSRDSPGATIVAGDNNIVFHMDAAAVPALRALLPELLTGFTPITLQGLNTASKNQLHQAFESTIKNRCYLPDSFLQRTGFDTQFSNFLASPLSILIILADAGFGKTSMLGHWVDLRISDHDAVFFDETRSDTHFEQSFREHLKLGFSLDDRLTVIKLLDLIDGELLATERYLLWFIDALDKMPNADTFLCELRDILAVSRPKRIKFVLSCRTSVWPYINYIERAGRVEKVVSDSVALELHLTEFNIDEVHTLYDYYRQRYPCLKPISDVCRSVLYECRIPLVFSLLVQTYASARGQPLPDKVVDAVKEYFGTLIEGHDRSFKHTFVIDIVHILLENSTDHMKVTDLYRESQRLNIGITKADLQLENPTSYLFQFVRSTLFRYDNEEISFNYDSVLEYLIALSYSEKLARSSSISDQKAILDGLVARLAVHYSERLARSSSISDQTVISNGGKVDVTGLVAKVSAATYSSLPFSILYLRQLVTPEIFSMLITALITVIEEYAVIETEEDYRSDFHSKIIDYHGFFLPAGLMSFGVHVSLSKNETWRRYQSAFYALMLLGHYSLREILQAISVNEGRVRILAKLFCLIDYIAFNNIDKLVEYVSEPDEEMRLCASWALFDLLRRSQEIVSKDEVFKRRWREIDHKRPDGVLAIPGEQLFTSNRWMMIYQEPFADYSQFREYQPRSFEITAGLCVIFPERLGNLDCAPIVQALIDNMASENPYFYCIASAVIDQLWMMMQATKRSNIMEGIIIKNILHHDRRVRMGLYSMLVLFVDKLEPAVPNLVQVLRKGDMDEEERIVAFRLVMLIGEKIAKETRVTLSVVSNEEKISRLMKICDLEEINAISDTTRRYVLEEICAFENQETKLLMLLFIMSYWSIRMHALEKESQEDFITRVGAMPDEGVRRQLLQDSKGRERIKEAEQGILSRLSEYIHEVEKRFREEFWKLGVPEEDLKKMGQNLKGVFYPPEIFSELKTYYKAVGNGCKGQECEENEIILAKVCDWLGRRAGLS